MPRTRKAARPNAGQTASAQCARSGMRTTPGANPALYWSAVALLAGVVILGLVKPLLTLGRFVPLDANEGWNAYFALAAIDGGQLYPPVGSLITNNYPPLSFYLVGGLGYLIGDNIFAGRVIALLGMLFVSWSIYYWLRLTGSAVKIASFGAAVFLAYAVTYGRDYVAMNDPQWLAQAMMLCGLLVLWSAEGDPHDAGKAGTRRIIAASLLMMAAGWTKDLLLPLPLTVTVWLAWRSRPAFAKWAVCSAIVLAVASGLAWWFYGPPFFDNLLAPRQYLRDQALFRTAGALKVFAPLLVLWSITLVRNRSDKRVGFISLYLVISAVIAVFVSGGAGVDVNSFFDVMVAGSSAAALAVETLWNRPAAGEPIPSSGGSPRAARGPAAAVALAVCIASYAVSLAPTQMEQIESVDAREKSAIEDIRLISAQGHGRAACELPSLCYWAKSRFMVDFFYLGQRIRTGVIPQSACSRAFDGSEIPVVQLDPNPRIREKLLPEYCNETITAHYRPIRRSTFGPLMVPNRRSFLR
jgi:hypothetical protein